MPVVERVMALGNWSLRLHPDTPRSVRDAINIANTGPGHIVITAAPVDDVKAWSDNALLDVARYVGVRTEVAGPDHELAGYGLAWWLGDADHQGTIIRTETTFASTAFETVIFNLLAAGPTSPIASGAHEGGVGNYTGRFGFCSVRSAVDSVCQAFGREWRVNSDFTLDAGSPANLYGTAPQALAVRKGGARDINTAGIESDLAVVADLEQTFSEVLVVGRSTTGTAGGANGYGWRDGRGGTVRRTALIEAASDVAPGLEAGVASALLDRYNLQLGRRDLDLRSDQYNVEGTVSCGAFIGVYDPDLDLRDTTNPDFYAGEEVWPQLVRVLGMTWPVTEGHGVYYRHTTGAASWAYYDLTPYVLWEQPGATLEVIAGGDADLWTAQPATGRADLVAQAQDRARAQSWDTYTPTWTGSVSNPAIGNGTLVGRFRRDGTTLHLRISVIPGSTTTFGSGVYSLGLPAGMTAAGGGEQWVTAKLWDGSNWPGIATVSGTVAQVYFPASAADTRLAVWQHNDPSVFANGHNLHIQGTVELAP